MKKIQLYSGLKLRKPTSFNGIFEEITLVRKFNKGWLVDRKKALSNKTSQFVFAERQITNAYQVF